MLDEATEVGHEVLFIIIVLHFYLDLPIQILHNLIFLVLHEPPPIILRHIRYVVSLAEDTKYCLIDFTEQFINLIDLDGCTLTHHLTQVL